MGKPIIPVRTKVYSLIAEGLTDPDALVAAVGVDAVWVRDIVEDELERERRRQRPGIYCPAAVTWINRIDADFMVRGL